MGHPVYTFNTGWLETVPKHTENSTKISQTKLSKVAKIAKLNEKTEQNEDERDKIFGRQPIIQINHPRMIKNGNSRASSNFFKFKINRLPRKYHVMHAAYFSLN